MGTWKKKNSYKNKVSYISVPAQIINSCFFSSETQSSGRSVSSRFLF
ncbi:BnaC05g44120D [Brassica napus]|uniref:BnaC05g44120D protein n=1 Tax=Brassica napus TaxID=3708 RepID=A0A078GN80_BRANA|nr:BnaC05g44120D [Brassica napus]